MKKSDKKRLVRQTLNLLIVFHLLVIVLIIVGFSLKLSGVDNLFGLEVIASRDIAYLLLVGSITLTILIIYHIKELLSLCKVENELDVSKAKNEIAHQTIDLLRCHRHDFLNHIQVIMGYVQLKKYDSAVAYMRDINSQLADIPDSNIQIPEVAVLLLAKKEVCMGYQITFDYQINTDLSQLKMQNVDLVRILANLIDNAIYEIKDKDNNKHIDVLINYDGNRYNFVVSNTGSYIEETNKIFEKGYSTKGNKGSGLGLYNVKTLVESKYGGSILVRSDPNLTTFSIIV